MEVTDCLHQDSSCFSEDTSPSYTLIVAAVVDGLWVVILWRLDALLCLLRHPTAESMKSHEDTVSFNKDFLYLLS